MTETATVIDVIDGDTIDVQLEGGEKETVRILGIDTPETTDNAEAERRAEWEGIEDLTYLGRWGDRASEFAKEELADATVELDPDANEPDRGSYGRLLRYVRYDPAGGTETSTEYNRRANDRSRGGVDILPRLKSGDSAKRSFRLRVSSGVKYAFASSLDGRRPVMTKDVLSSACSPVNGAFRPGRAGRVNGRIPFVLAGRVFSLRGTSIRVRPVGRDVEEWFSGFITRWDRDAKRPCRQRRRVRPGEDRRHLRGSRTTKAHRQPICRPSTADAEVHVGFIPRLKPGAFSLYFCNVAPVADLAFLLLYLYDKNKYQIS